MTELTNFYALLIGIDCYESNNLYKNLQGCVGDIDLVADYLQKTLQIPCENIWKLTSPFEESSILAEIRSARKEVKPSYGNIINAFKEITETARSGEQVYIHYSGHGGRALTVYPELKGEGQNDESIVPVDVGSLGNHYLRDVEIATLIKRLTDKGCIVTVIFDSCHSGGATRGDCAIRGSETDEIDTAPRSRDSLVASREELLNNWRILTQANPEISTGWLPKTEDYVFLAACRPSEYAYEYAINGGKRNGALTYWIIDTLTGSTSPLTYRSLYNRVKGMIQSKFPQQLPMLTGNSDRLVFGNKKEFIPYAVNVVKVDENQQRITLDAGLAQGLSQGTRFAIYPLNAKDFVDKTQQIALAEITDELRADKSTAKILDVTAGGIAVRGKIEPGATAVMLAAPVDLIRKVRFFADKKAGDKENELQSDLVNKQTVALEKVRQAIAENGWVVEVKDGEEAHYQVAVGRDGEYEISIGMPVKNLRPMLMINDSQAPEKVVSRLVHLVKYQSVQALDNIASELTDYVEFQLCNQNKQPLPDADNLTLKAGGISYLRVKNTYAQPLNIAVLDLEPTWQISQIPIQGDDSSFFALQPNQEVYTKLRLQLPGDGYQRAKETLKIFVTQGLANFQWLKLPSLDRGLEARGDLNSQLREKAEALRTRGNAPIINPLNNLFSAIGADIDNPPNITRTFVYESDANAEWMTQQIQIVITQ